jgi:hypothetical protein
LATALLARSLGWRSLSSGDSGKWPVPDRINAAKALCGYLYPKVQPVDINPDAARLNVTIIRFSDLPPSEQALEHNQGAHLRLPAPDERNGRAD